MRIVITVTVALALGGVSGAHAQAPYLVKDINPAGGSDPFHLTVAGDRLFFEATGGEGREIWVTEGTAATTLPTNPGPGGFVINRPLGLGRDLLFNNFGPPLAGLWRAGGSPASTNFVSPILVGPATTIGSVALLAAHKGLWRSDGTPEGTTQLVPLPTSNPIFPSAFAARSATRLSWRGPPSRPRSGDRTGHRKDRCEWGRSLRRPGPRSGTS